MTVFALAKQTDEESKVHHSQYITYENKDKPAKGTKEPPQTD
jgi:hypothetical protein